MAERTLYTLRISNFGFFPRTYEDTDAGSVLEIIKGLERPIYEILRKKGKGWERIHITTLEHEASLL